ncbi:MAG: hypothetical protein ACFE94_00110 [Candidatus Hodarchaeota archaeon]
MIKKGKFQLLSYLVDEYLIYYKSLNKNKKLIAFAIFEAVAINPFIAALNQLLKKRYIQYYTIQLNILGNINNIFLVNFEEIKKERIIKAFHELQQKLVEENKQYKILRNSKLERKFLEPIIKNMDSNVSLMKHGESILVLNNDKSYLLDFYYIDFNYLEKKDTFINNFIKIINNYDREGYLILNFKIDNNEEIKFSPYFVEYITKTDDSFKIENNINTFFNHNLLKRYNLKIKEIFIYLWRLGISNGVFPLKYLNLSSTTKNQNTLTRLVKFNQELEQNLLKYQLEYIRFSKNLLFIEEKFLFIILTKLDSDYIQKIIEKHHSKYFIYITILSKKELEKLVNITNLKSLHNIQVLNSNEIVNLDYNIFKKNR